MDDATPLLDRPATVGDIIVYNLAIPIVVTALGLMLLGPGWLGRFGHVFDSLGGKLPLATRFLLSYGALFCHLGAAFALVLAYVGVFAAKGNRTRIACVCGGNLVLLAAVYVLLVGMYRPLLELQSAVRG